MEAAGRWTETGLLEKSGQEVLVRGSASNSVD
jgi:hypothetical protein